MAVGPPATLQGQAGIPGPLIAASQLRPALPGEC